MEAWQSAGNEWMNAAQVYFYTVWWPYWKSSLVPNKRKIPNTEIKYLEQLKLALTC